MFEIKLIMMTIEDKTGWGVAGKDVHKALGIEGKYWPWSRRKIKTFGFENKIDFIHVPFVDYFYSRGAAWQIVSRANTSIGRAYRKSLVHLDNYVKAIEILESYLEMAELVGDAQGIGVELANKATKPMGIDASILFRFRHLL